MTDWKRACEQLWGEDWIAPLADVLGVSRRSVERWKAGQISIPKDVEHDLTLWLEENAAGPALERRAYGAVLRRLANGESGKALLRAFKAHIEALDDIEFDARTGGFPQLLGKVRVKATTEDQ